MHVIPWWSTVFAHFVLKVSDLTIIFFFSCSLQILLVPSLFFLHSRFICIPGQLSCSFVRLLGLLLSKFLVLLGLLGGFFFCFLFLLFDIFCVFFELLFSRFLAFLSLVSTYLRRRMMLPVAVNITARCYMYAFMYVCMYICMHVYIYIYVWMNICL